MITNNRVPVPLLVFGAVLGAYLVVRAALEFVMIDYHDPAGYRADWGGPSLLGVLAVHAGPGLVVAGVTAYRLIASRR